MTLAIIITGILAYVMVFAIYLAAGVADRRKQARRMAELKRELRMERRS